MGRSTIDVDTDHLTEVVSLLKQFVAVVGSEYSPDDRCVRLRIEGETVPDCDRVVAMVTNDRVGGSLHIEFRHAPA